MNLNDDRPNDRTTAFEVRKKVRKTDSVGLILTSLVVFFLNIISVGRITIIGAFIDDIFFSFLFGWFKYFIYLLFFLIDISIYFGIKYKFKKRFISMFFVTWIILCWVISSLLFIVAFSKESSQFKVDNIITGSVFTDSIKSYYNNWHQHSIFVAKPEAWYISNPAGYWNLWAGGGIIGTLLAGVFSYTTIFGSLVFSLFALFLNQVWIFTGNPFYLFQPKDRRKGSRLRILSLRGNNKKTSKKGKLFNVINVNDNFNFDEQDIIQYAQESDITIELPSFGKKVPTDVYQDITAEIYRPQSLFEKKDYSNQPSFKNNAENIDYSRMQKRSRSNYEPTRNNTYTQLDNNYNRDQKYNNFNPEKNLKPTNFNQPKEVSPTIYMPNRGYKNIAEVNKDELTQYAPSSPSDLKKKNDLWNKVHNNTTEEMGYGQYGPVSPQKARELFEKETDLSPFGMSGHTQEYLKGNKLVVPKKTKSSKTQFVSRDQLTIEDFIDTSNKEFEEQELRQKEYVSYTAPIEEKINKTIINSSDEFLINENNYVPSNKVINVNVSTFTEKELHINNDYILPNVELLKNIKVNATDEKARVDSAQAKANAINKTFAQFGVKATVKKINQGPSVTKFEIEPEPGTKVNSIISLENDLKLALASQNVRIEAPIEGKAAVGIEVANDNPVPVALRGVIESTPLQKLNSKLLFSIGKTVTGELLFGELDKMPHLLVAGSTGSGKSVMINNIIISILMRSKPYEVKFLMIDPKKVELSIYSSIPHLLAPVISDMNIANAALKKVINEMDRRYSLFTKTSTKNIDGYNSKIKDKKFRLPYYVIIIDELADLMMTANKKDVEDSIMRLTQMARAAGIHLIVATQRPSTDVLTGVIKSNIPTRIAFAVASQIDSRTILDHGGAEKLIGKGDLLYMPPGNTSLIRAQGSYVSDEDIHKIVKFCSNQDDQFFDPDFENLEQQQAAISSSGNSGGDSMYNEIKQYIIDTKKASTSLIQRHFSIGYNRAAKIIDQLELDGIIGPQNGAKPREVFVQKRQID